ncbi:hypothetical protein MMC14_004648 [Varicellaria rhodocarpa]|nr:hypothetical protein [Varicellaria rhodocarpa]
MKASSQLLFLRPSSILYTKLPTKPLIIPTSILPTPSTKTPSTPRPHTRSFVSNPLTPQLQTLHAARTLPYPSSALFALIADIAAYTDFLPYCNSSTVTALSAPHPSTSKTYPAEAHLRIGWAGYDEAFTSKVFCVPDTCVEAVAGAVRTTLPTSDLQHYGGEDAKSAHVPGNEIFQSLRTCWTLREFPFKPLPSDGKTPQEGSADLPSRARTEVELQIEVRFASAMYAALSQAAAPKMAAFMVGAFERRAREVLGKGEVGDGEQMGSGEDSALETAVGGR